MGVNDREDEKRYNKRQRAKEQRSRRASAAGTVDWNSFPWLEAATLVEALAREGGALRLGQTRDGGAWALGVYLGDDYATEYVKPQEDTQVALAEIAEAWLPDKGEWYHERLNMSRTSGGTR